MSLNPRTTELPLLGLGARPLTPELTSCEWLWIRATGVAWRAEASHEVDWCGAVRRGINSVVSVRVYILHITNNIWYIYLYLNYTVYKAGISSH